MVVVAQLVRVLVCGAEGRRFEPGQPPLTKKSLNFRTFFVCITYRPSVLSTINLSFLLAISHAMAKAY